LSFFVLFPLFYAGSKRSFLTPDTIRYHPLRSFPAVVRGALIFFVLFPLFYAGSKRLFLTPDTLRYHPLRSFPAVARGFLIFFVFFPLFYAGSKRSFLTPDTIRHLVSFCCLVDTSGDFLQIYLCMSEKSCTFAGAKLWRVPKIQ